MGVGSGDKRGVVVALTAGWGEAVGDSGIIAGVLSGRGSGSAPVHAVSKKLVSKILANPANRNVDKEALCDRKNIPLSLDEAYL